MRIAFTVIKGPNNGHEAVFDGPREILVGRSKGAEFRLQDDPSVSNAHFMVTITRRKCYLRDCSTNHTYVNGRIVQSCVLQDDDRIKAGTNIIRVAIGYDKQSLPSSAVDGIVPPASAQRFPVIDGYRIIAEIGKGGMGRVYEALPLKKTAHHRVALKQLALTSALSEKERRDWIRRFRREARVLYKLIHPNIVAFHDMIEAHDSLFIEMEYVRGHDAKWWLKEHMRKKQCPLSVERAVRWSCQVLEALAFAHTRKYIHRDIKPRNLIISSSGNEETVKLVDFGLSKCYDDAERSIGPPTPSGVQAGSEGFMSPQHYHDFAKVGPEDDQYQVAATLYNLLTDTVYDFRQPVPILMHREIPKALAEVIHRALDTNKENRFPDVIAFRDALLPFAAARRG